jgi:hypothetical protein
MMLSLWNKKKYSIVDFYDYEFEKGRPFTIIILKNKIKNKNIALINLHSGHYINTEKTIFDIINNFIKDNIKLSIKKTVNRVIMSGDFNRNVYEDETSEYKIKFYDEFQLKRFKNTKQTCCSINGYGYTNIYDHVIDSKAIVEKKILGNSVKSYKIPSSDHILIIAKLKN